MSILVNLQASEASVIQHYSFIFVAEVIKINYPQKQLKL